MERMGSLDATFLAVEDSVNHMHIGSIGVFEGPPPPYEALRDLIGSKLPLVPRYRQKPKTAPAGIGRPVWIDDPHFRLEYHVRHTALPPPGTEADLRNLIGRVMSQQLDRHRPLWEAWMIEGLPDGAWALISKVHHCMVDGIAGTDLLAVILDLEPDGGGDPPADDWKPQPEPSTLDMLRHSIGGLLGAPVRVVQGAIDTARHPDAAGPRLTATLRGLPPLLTGVGKPAPGSSLLGPIGPHRRYEATRVSIDDVRTVRTALGGTLNDVVLALVTSGLRELLLSRGESVDGRTVRALIPVSVRTPDARGVYDNRVSAMFAALPVGIDDPAERLAAARAEMETLKASQEAVAAEAVTAMTNFAPPLLAALFARAGVHQQVAVETVATNVPGPQFPLYACGRKMLEAYPYVPISGHIRVGIAIFSYLGWLYFGITGDFDGAPDIDVARAGIDDGIAELLKACG